MAPKFHKLKINKIVRDTSDSVSISFDIPKDLADTFVYKAGQYLTIKVPIDEKDNRRAYSISSSPYDKKDLTVTVKKVDSGCVSVYLNESIKVGELLEVMPPMGNFTPQLDASKKTGYVLFAGGSGIAPLISILKTVLVAEPDAPICLFYANRSLNSIIFYDELKQLEAQHRDRLKVVYSLTQFDENWSGHKGRFNAMNVSVLIHRFAEDMFRSAEHYICGPNGMMRQIENALGILNIPKDKVRKESFTAPLPNELGETSAKKSSVVLLRRDVKVKMYGEILNITVEPDETITAALSRIGNEPPVSCQIGACSTCLGKVKSGEVIMDEREGLTDKEIAAGFILTCQAHPITDNCFIDFD